MCKRIANKYRKPHSSKVSLPVKHKTLTFEYGSDYTGHVYDLKECI